MGLFKKKFSKLQRSDVTNAVIDLEKQESSLEAAIVKADTDVAELMVKGKLEKSNDLKLLYAKKILHLKAEKQQYIKRATYLLYNIQMLQRLRDAIDDNSFFSTTGATSLNNLLADQKGLAKFLNQALGTRIKAEDVLTSADETFNEIQLGYEENSAIYGINTKEDDLLAMFETQEALELESEPQEDAVGKKTKLSDSSND